MGPGGGVVVFQDIDDRKATEARLQQTVVELGEQSELLRTILDSIREGIIVSDNSGEFLYINPGAKAILDQEYFIRRQGKWSEKSKYIYYYPDRVTPIENEDLPLPPRHLQGRGHRRHAHIRAPAEPLERRHFSPGVRKASPERRRRDQGGCHHLPRSHP